MPFPTIRPGILTPYDAATINRALVALDRLAGVGMSGPELTGGVNLVSELGGLHVSLDRPLPEVVRVTSATPTGGFYPAMRQTWDPAANNGSGGWADLDRVWVQGYNGETLQARRYPAVQAGANPADSAPLFGVAAAGGADLVQKIVTAVCPVNKTVQSIYTSNSLDLYSLAINTWTSVGGGLAKTFTLAGAALVLVTVDLEYSYTFHNSGNAISFFAALVVDGTREDATQDVMQFTFNRSGTGSGDGGSSCRSKTFVLNLAAGTHTLDLQVENVFAASTDAYGSIREGTRFTLHAETGLAEQSNLVSVPGATAGVTRCRTSPVDCTCPASSSGSGTGSGTGSGSGGGGGTITSTELGTESTGSSPATSLTLAGVTLAAGDYLLVHVGRTATALPSAVTWNGNALTLLVHVGTPTVGGTTGDVATYGLKITVGGTGDIVVTLPAPAVIEMDATAVHGATGTADVIGGTFGTSSAPDLGTVSPPTTPAYLDAVFLLLDPGGLWSWLGGFTEGQDVTVSVSGVSVDLAPGYQVAAGAGGFHAALSGVASCSGWAGTCVSVA